MCADMESVRAEMKAAGLNRAEMPADPLPLFETWLQQAQEAQLPYPTAMSLATASKTGSVSSRIVLLRYFDQHGFVFFSGYETKKAEQIAENAQVALLFPWLMLDRQVKIIGTAKKISGRESLHFFMTRSRESQIGAWLTQSSEKVNSKSILRSNWEHMKQKFRNRQIPLPESWGGYRIVPNSIEFWQGNQDGLHDRFVYSALPEGEWSLTRLVP